MEVTPDHPIYVEGRGWVWAENLAIGDRLRRADGGWAKVLAVERVELEAPQRVYNFTVKGPHTYFVLEVGVLVHNASCGPNESGLLARYKQTRWKSAGYDVNNLKIQNLIGEGYYPEDVIRLYRGQTELYEAVISSAARSKETLAEGFEYSKYMFDEGLIDLARKKPTLGFDYGRLERGEMSALEFILSMHKSIAYEDIPSPFIAMASTYDAAWLFAKHNLVYKRIPGFQTFAPEAVVLEIVIPKKEVIDVGQTLKIPDREAEFVTLHQLPNKYITRYKKVVPDTIALSHDDDWEKLIPIIEQLETDWLKYPYD